MVNGARKHDQLCPCDACLGARKRGAQHGLEAFRKIVDLCALLKQELLQREQMYRQADKDRRALLRICAKLATEFHELGLAAAEGGFGSPGPAGPPHDDKIGECTNEICVEAREGILAIGVDRARDPGTLVQAIINKEASGK